MKGDEIKMEYKFDSDWLYHFMMMFTFGMLAALFVKTGEYKHLAFAIFVALILSWEPKDSKSKNKRGKK